VLSRSCIDPHDTSRLSLRFGMSQRTTPWGCQQRTPRTSRQADY
jgi:hypothetical protein